MANRTLFQSFLGKLLPAATAANEAGGRAYSFTPAHALAQYAVTGCLNGTFYATAETQLDTVLKLCTGVEAETVAKIAVYARRKGHMKDLPALLLAHLAVVDGSLFERTFPHVVDNGKMLRSFVQILRSGVVGRKSLGSRPKRLVRGWLESRSDDQLFAASVGQRPSLADVVKMVHPKPRAASRRALYGYLLGREHDASALPESVRCFEAFKAGDRMEVPGVPFQMLTSLDLSKNEWRAIARGAGWQMTRMNLNTFVRHRVFEDADLVRVVAERLRDGAAIRRARVFPYQLFAAWRNADPAVPAAIRQALHDATELAVSNVPRINGQVYVLVDVSGSMQSPVTGCRRGSTTAVRCVDVAALIAAAFVRANPSTEVLPFDTAVRPVRLEARDTVLTNAQRLAISGGGTNCSAPLQKLNRRRAAGDLVVYVSDNQSWVDRGQGRGTATLTEWQGFRARNPKARLVCIDVQPYGTTQAHDREDILNVGGFSDAVFDVVQSFASGLLGSEHWLQAVESIDLNARE